VNKPKQQANKKGKGKGKGKADKNKQKRNCPLYLEELRTNKNKKAEHTAELQGFRVERKLSYGEQYLRLFVHTVTSNGISISLNSIFYFSAISVNGVFEIDMNGNVSKYNNNSIFSINKKRKLSQEFKEYLGKKLKLFRSDEVVNFKQEFKEYLGKNGIVQHLTSPYTPQQNGVSERRNRTLLDMVRSMFNLTTLPLSFWDYALESAVRILNMVPTKKVDKTPYEIWHGKAPNLSYLKVWGCEAYVKRDSADKLQQRSVKCIFVGYPKETMGYYFYFPPENKVIVARYGDFLERDLISQEFSGRDYDLEDDHMDTLPSENTSEILVEPESLGPPSELIPVRRFERTTRAPNRLCLNMEVEDDVVWDLGEPTNYKAAMLDPDKVIWQGAMDEEMNSIKVNEVWAEVDPPLNAKIIRSKWLFKKKTDMDGEVHTYKARLVAIGHTQSYGIVTTGGDIFSM
ncbi:retrotransposon protein, putative, ty1-copia subclass, partial [Tanacetum coccineum]